MEYDAVVAGIGVVAVRVPGSRLRVKLHVAPAEEAADPDARIDEIGPGVPVRDPRESNRDLLTPVRQEGEMRERLVLPETAERGFACCALWQRGRTVFSPGGASAAPVAL